MASVEIPVTEARAHISDVTNRAEYGGEIIYLTRHNRRAAAVVPAEAAELLEKLEDLADVEEVRQVLATATDEDFVPFRRRTRREG
ncbi:type II toxin-antitoxin system prevent-host-death family antitoxin [Saccharomonospora sp.]|uniref:type II toxin-antitoxin system prevent-host-death family antitoxin n=1 Tax=Saccharomonospora sp. TaxID=33913 RepID=UPI002601EE76|nr:type II toxin-antitoxin system prevent-host-death family antitoxin [Saccharomonospora sp.]